MVINCFIHVNDVIVIHSFYHSFVDAGVDIFIEEMNFHAIWTPGHTVGMFSKVCLRLWSFNLGHIVYFLKSTTPPCLFSGDHLFIGGCGMYLYVCVYVLFMLLNVRKNI